jgi:hypothetical protein
MDTKSLTETEVRKIESAFQFKKLDSPVFDKQSQHFEIHPQKRQVTIRFKYAHPSPEFYNQNMGGQSLAEELQKGEGVPDYLEPVSTPKPIGDGKYEITYRVPQGINPSCSTL